jgi:iron complex outermembrane receptor protein
MLSNGNHRLVEDLRVMTSSRRGFQGLRLRQMALLATTFQIGSLAWAEAPEVASNATGALEEITVTAQRRSESAQSVPITVNALSASDIRSAGLTDSNSLTGTVPSLNISTEGPQMYTLRGVGTTGTTVGSEQSVALYLDGVYLYDAWASTFPLNAVQRVEVLYGPQGTLFGRNTTGGVIQYISRDPAESTLETEVGYANYQTTTASLYAAQRVSDLFAANVSLNYRNQGQGWGYDNYLPDEKFNYSDYLSVQTKMVFTPGPDTRITGMFWLNNSKTSGLNSQLSPGTAGLDGVVRDLNRYQYVANTPDSDREKSYLGYVRLDQDLAFGKFVSLTSFRKVDGDFRLDQDTTPLTVVNSRLVQPAQAFSQELQLLSPNSADVLTWAGGLYYFGGRASLAPISIAGLAAAPLPEIEFHQTELTYSGAVFGQLTWKFLPDTGLTVGARYTDETEHQRSHTSSLGAQLFANTDQSTDSSGTTGRVSLNHNFTPDVMGYISYNRGLKSGGFNMVAAVNEPAYKPEHLDAYEIGAKSELFDRRLRLNGSAFWYQFKDIQVQSIVAGQVQTNNAAAATIRGFNLDFEALAVENLKINGSLGYLDTYYSSFPGASYYLLNPYNSVPAGVTCPAPANPAVGAATLCSFDAAGKRTSFAPKWSATLGETYKVPTAIGSFSWSVFAKFMAKQFQSPDNFGSIPAHTLVNSALSYWTADDHFGVRLWANNLFDKHYLNDLLEENVGFLQVPGDPRTYGMAFDVKF